jgi:hypothetical protein
VSSGLRTKAAVLIVAGARGPGGSAMPLDDWRLARDGLEHENFGRDSVLDLLGEAGRDLSVRRLCDYRGRLALE